MSRNENIIEIKDGNTMTYAAFKAVKTVIEECNDNKFNWTHVDVYPGLVVVTLGSSLQMKYKYSEDDGRDIKLDNRIQVPDYSLS